MSDPTDPSIEPHPEAVSLADRLTLLNQSGHDWMTPDVQTALAAAPMPDNALIEVADAIKQRVASTWDGVSHFFDDPVLHKQPTTTLALQRYVTAAMGPWPIENGDLMHVQRQIQAAGFGTDLPVTGVWDGSWQAANQQLGEKHFKDQLGGEGPGKVETGGALRGFLRYLLPTGQASAIWGMVKAIPGSARNLIADVTGGARGDLTAIGSLLTDPLHPGEAKRKAVAQSDRSGAAISRALGAKITDEEYTRQQGIARAIDDLGTAFMFTGVAKPLAAGAKGAVSKGAADGLGTRITTDAAIRGPGVVAKSLLRPVGTRAAAGAGVGAVTGGVIGGVKDGDLGGAATGAVTGALAGAAGGALIPRKAFQNLPVLRNTGPTLGKLLDKDGLYYRARTRLATPYQYGAVRAASGVMGATTAASVKIGAATTLENALGGGNLSRNVNSSAPLDGVDDAIRNRLAVTAYGRRFSLGIDDLMFFLHPPIGGPGSATEEITRTARGSMDNINRALGEVGAIGQVEQATGKSFQQLTALAGGDPDRVHLWIGHKVRQQAGWFHAERQMDLARARGEAPEQFSDAWYEQKRALASQVWHDPVLQKKAMGDMLAEGNFLFRQVENEIKTSTIKGDAHLRHELSTYLDAGDELTHGVLPHSDTLITPQAIRSYKAAKADAEFAQQLKLSDAPPTPMLGAEFLRTNPTLPAEGAIGMARSDTLTRQQALRDAKAFTARVEEGGGSPEEHLALQEEMRTYLEDNFGLDARALRAFPTAEKLAEIIEKRSKDLAAEVYLPMDAPAELQRAFKRIEDLGYRVVAGTDIGHMFRSNLPPLPDLGQPIAGARKLVSALGLNTQHFSRLDYGADRRMRVVQALQRRVDQGKITLPPHYTVQTLLADLQDDDILARELPWMTNVAFSLARRAQQPAIDRLAAAEGVGRDEAERLLKNNIASATGLRDISLKHIRRVLTRTDNLHWGEPDGIGLMSKEHADEVYRAILEGYSQTPASVLGLSKVEDMIRYLPFKIPGGSGSTAGMGLRNLPNKIAQLRDTYRFQLSPYFDLRRVAKTNVKMHADGVAPTGQPVRTMVESGDFDQAHQFLDRLKGQVDPKYRYLDEADKFLDSQGVFGLYNPRHYEAYYAWQKKQAGFSDEEIRKGLIRVFQYGNSEREGRTAAERTANTIFFPFSFEKTVVRNLGAYLLDRPAQALVLSNALDAYRDFNNHHLNGDNPLAASWFEQHLPLLNEALRLNAFARGISPGELGGINAPLLNAFLPQSWESDRASNKTLKRFVPAVADLQRVMREGSEQSRIIRTSLVNGMSIVSDQVTNTKRGPLDARPSNKTDHAQRQEAYDLRNKLVKALKPVIDWNLSHSKDEEKYHWPLTGDLPDELRGQTVNSTTIGLLVHSQYPAFDPTAGAAFAIAKQAEANAFVARHAGTPLYEPYKEYLDKARTAVRHLNDDSYPPEQAAQITELFRQQAMRYAEKDPAFLKWYRGTFVRAFGPIEKV